MRKLEITVHEDAIQARRGGTEIPQRFKGQFKGLDHGKIVAVNSNKTYDVQIADRAFPLSGVMVSNPKAIFKVGDQVVIGHLHGNQYLPFIFSRSANINAQDVSRPNSVVILGLLGNWSQGQGCPGLTGMTLVQNEPFVIDAGLDSSYADVSPGHSSLPILGQVVFESASSQSVLAVLWQKERMTGLYGLEITAFEHSATSPMPTLWTLAIGTSYALPTGLELELDYRDGYLIHDRSSRQLCAFGSGTADLRNMAYVVTEAGTLAYSGTFGQRAHQSTFFAGRLIKCWHSFNRSGFAADTLRETQDQLIRAFKQNSTGLTSAWTLDPQTLLPSCQISTSEAHYAANDDKGQGRWPIHVASKTMVVWVSGSEQVAASGNNTLMQLLPNDFTYATVTSAVAYNWGRTKVQRAKIVGINTDTGEVRWSREIVNTASALNDQDSIDYTDTNVSNPSGPQSIAQNYDGVGASYTDVYNYSGFAYQGSVPMGPFSYTCSPANSTLVDPDEGTNEDEYCTYTGSYVGTWHNYVGLGIAANGPDYEFFEPGGLRLFPLPVSQGIQASFSLALDNEALVAKSPVGGCHAIDSQGYTFTAYALPRPIVSGRSDKDYAIASMSEMEWREISAEEWIAIPPESQLPGGPTQYLVCAQYAAYAQQDLYWMGKVEQLTKSIVTFTGPLGDDLGDNDVSQYVTRANSSFTWPLVSQIYQIIPIYEANVFLLLRDRFIDYPTDTLPSVVVDVWEWGSGSTLVETVELWTDRSTYYDVGLDVTRRKFDQYCEQICCGKGAANSGGYWAVFRLRVHDQELDTYSNEWVRLEFPGGGVVDVTRYSTTDGNTWPGGLGQQSSMAIAGDRSINSTEQFSSGAWRVRSKSFI